MRKDRHRRNGADSEPLTEVAEHVGVDLDDEPSAGRPTGDGRQLGRHHPTRCAPRRPEVHDDRQGRLCNQSLEVGRGSDVERRRWRAQGRLALPTTNRVAQSIESQSIALTAIRTGDEDAAVVDF